MLPRMQWVAAVAIGAGAAVMTGCQADFAADIRNDTPQPLYAQMFIKPNASWGSATRAAQLRLGPGDRAFIGPVRAGAQPGRVYLVVDTLPNPERPSSLDLAPGVTFVDVTQAGDGTAGPLRLSIKPAPGEAGFRAAEQHEETPRGDEP